MFEYSHKFSSHNNTFVPIGTTDSFSVFIVILRSNLTLAQQQHSKSIVPLAAGSWLQFNYMPRCRETNGVQTVSSVNI